MTDAQQEQVQPERPPMTGRGSGVEAWREYAAAVTGSPVDSWQALSKEEVVELLDAEGAEQHDDQGDEDAGTDEGGGTEQVEADPDAASAPRRRSPEWMVPTDDGPVPESVVRQQQRDDWHAKAAKARAAREAKAKGDGISSADVAALNPTGGE